MDTGTRPSPPTSTVSSAGLGGSRVCLSPLSGVAAAAAAVARQDAGQVDAMENTPLIYASAAGDAGGATRLLEDGAEVNHRNRVGDTALIYACGNARSEVVAVLLARGAAVHVANDDGETPLHHACAAGDLASVKALVAAGSEVHARSAGGLTPLHNAVWRRQTGVVSHLLSVGADPNERTADGLTALHLACAAAPPARKAASADLIGLLIRYQADVRARESGGGLLPAHYLVQSGASADVELMLRACHAAQELSGALIPTDDHGMSLLHHAAMVGCHESLELLISWPFEIWPHVMIGLQDKNGRTALHFAAAAKSIYAVRLLVERGKAPLEIRDFQGRLPAECAVDPQIAQYLSQATQAARVLLPGLPQQEPPQSQQLHRP